MSAMTAMRSRRLPRVYTLKRIDGWLLYSFAYLNEAACCDIYAIKYIRPMSDNDMRVKNPESLQRLGKQLRRYRKQAGLVQSKVPGMRQASVSKIENGGDVTLDTFVSYAAALGLELVAVPIGQALALEAPVLRAEEQTSDPSRMARPLDLLDEFSYLRDEE